jgi:hypothetical protein
LDSIFNSKYDEFVGNLRDVFPELTPALDAASALPLADRISKFRAEVMPQILARSFLALSCPMPSGPPSPLIVKLLFRSS